MLKLPQLDRPRRIARIAEQPAAWTHYLVGRRRKRLAAALPPAVFDPASIASLRLWLRGDDIGVSDGLPVSLWPDASGYSCRIPTCSLNRRHSVADRNNTDASCGGAFPLSDSRAPRVSRCLAMKSPA